MADRIETIRLIANVSNYVTGMEAARLKTLQMANDSQAKLALTRSSLQTTGTAFLAIGAVAAAGVAVAVAAFAEFDAKMSQVQSLSHATSGDMLLLRDAALSLGQGIGFSASEVADAEIELVKAGVGVSDILGGALKGSLELAAAGQISVADATEIATIALTQFGLKGQDIPHVADLLSAGADKALGGVSDLGEALKSGGLVAAQFGVSLDETVGTLSAFANAGLLGQTAGTDLRQMLLQLAQPSKQAADLMDQLHIKAYDASGQFIGLAGLAGQLKAGLGGLTQEQRNTDEAVIFGTRAINGANVLYNEGAEGIKKWTSEVNDSGFAAQQAAGKMNNLQGDFKKLTAGLQTDFIEAGSGANDVLRQLTQGATGIADAIGKIPAPVLDAGLGLGAIIGTVGLVGGTVFNAIPKIIEFRDALSTISGGGAAVAKGVGIASGAVAAAGVVFSVWAAQQARATAQTKAFEDSLNSVNGTATKYTRTLVAQALAAEQDSLSHATFFETAKKAGVSQSELTDAVLKGGKALDDVKQKITAYGNTPFLPGASQTANSLVQELDALNGQLGQSKENLKDEAAANADAADSTDANTQALNALQGQAADAGTAVSNLAEQIKGFASGTLDARQANRDFQDAIDKATQSVKDNGTSLDDNTQKGRDNEASLDAIAKKALELASAKYTETGSQQDATAAIQQGRDALIAQLGQYGITGDAAQQYADKLGLIPGNVDTIVNLSGADAATLAISNLRAQIAALPTKVGLSVTASGSVVYSDSRNGSRASGGIIPGAPSNTDNRIYAVATGEFITNARATAKPENRRMLEFINSGGVAGSYATGGFVAPTYQRTTPPAQVTSTRQAPTVSIGSIIAADPQDAVRQLERSQRRANALAGIGRTVLP